MIDPFFRQRDLLTPNDLRGLDVDVVGAGSLGGSVTLCLCKMGFGIAGRLTLTDFDRCEGHNLATQWFRGSHVLMEQPKVEALAETVALVCDREIETVVGRFRGDESRPLGPVVVLAVDSLAERRRIWRRLRERDDVRLVIDPRAGAEIVEIWCVDRERDDAAEYERSLANPAAAHRDPCTGQGILYTVLGAAAIVGRLLRAYARGLPFPRHVAFDFANFFVEVAPSAEKRGQDTDSTVRSDVPRHRRK